MSKNKHLFSKSKHILLLLNILHNNYTELRKLNYLSHNLCILENKLFYSKIIRWITVRLVYENITNRNNYNYIVRNLICNQN